MRKGHGNSEGAAALLGNPAGLNIANYPLDAWWVAGLSSEVADTPVACWIVDLPVVLYRRADGSPVALDNRCPHRSAPLSSGYVSGDDLVCGYHGFQFSPSGICQRIPTQEHIPVNCAVRAYPVIEQPPLIWIWTGDASLAASVDLPGTVDWASDPSRTTASGYFEVGCNYLALKENVLDLSHFGFVHPTTLGITDWTHPPSVEAEGETVTYIQDFYQSPLPALFGIPTGIGTERLVNRRAWGTCTSPALHLSGTDIEDAEAAPTERRTYSVRVAHITTPIDSRSCHYWWFFSQDYGDMSPTDLGVRISAAFLEDKAILEATESLVRRDPRGRKYPMVGVECDAAALQARKIVYRAMLVASKGRQQ